MSALLHPSRPNDSMLSRQQRHPQGDHPCFLLTNVPSLMDEDDDIDVDDESLLSTSDDDESLVDEEEELLGLSFIESFEEMDDVEQIVAV